MIEKYNEVNKIIIRSCFYRMTIYVSSFNIIVILSLKLLYYRYIEVSTMIVFIIKKFNFDSVTYRKRIITLMML